MALANVPAPGTGSDVARGQIVGQADQRLALARQVAAARRLAATRAARPVDRQTPVDDRPGLIAQPGGRVVIQKLLLLGIQQRAATAQRGEQDRPIQDRDQPAQW